MPKKLRPVGNITAITGTYKKDGEDKNRYLTIGTLFQRLDDNENPTNKMVMKLDTYPLPNENGEVWVNIYPIQKKGDSDDSGNQEIDDKPIDLSEIPF